MFHENGTTTGICCPFLKQGSQLNNMLVKVQVVGLGPKEFPVWPFHPVVHQFQGKDIHCNRITQDHWEHFPTSGSCQPCRWQRTQLYAVCRSCFKKIVESIALEACHKWCLTAYGAVGQPGILASILFISLGTQHLTRHTNIANSCFLSHWIPLKKWVPVSANPILLQLGLYSFQCFVTGGAQSQQKVDITVQKLNVLLCT